MSTTTIQSDAFATTDALRFMLAWAWRLTQPFIKRSIDIVLASVALVFALPICFVVVAVVWLQGPQYRGPIIVTHHRVGRYGKKLRVLKLRTLPVGHVPLTIPNFEVPRIIESIRRIGLDELPQLVLVLFGRMSVFGAIRPLLPKDLAVRHGDAAAEILTMRPCLFGEFSLQVRTDPGWSSVEVQTPHYDDPVTQMALAYVRRWSLMKDIRIGWTGLRMVAYKLAPHHRTFTSRTRTPPLQDISELATVQSLETSP